MGFYCNESTRHSPGPAQEKDRQAGGWRPGAWVLSACLAIFPAASAAQELPLMPWPAKLSTAGGKLAVHGPFRVNWQGRHDERLDRALERFAADVRLRTGLAMRTPGPALAIKVAADAPRIPALGERESYGLVVDDTGVTLTAEQPAGVLRGLATLRQLIDADAEGFALPKLSIQDAPRFAWRGLLLDVARHFVSIPTLKRQIDAMERVKLNVLHLHLSDNEAFRIESRRFPRLTQFASTPGHYTQDEVRDLVAYAAARGVRIVPEIDMPGHTGAILLAYPELSASPVNPADRIGLRSLAMDPAKPATHAFIKELLTEMSALFPDAYFHAGGDEVSAKAWADNPAIRAFMEKEGLKDHAALQRHFFGRVNAVLNGLGKTTVGWEEIADGEIDDRILVQAWRSSQATAHITAQNNPAIVSAGYYLDLLRPGASHYAIDPLDVLATPPDDPHHVLGPTPAAALSRRQQEAVIGAEAALWSEVLTDEMVDGRLWPRAALLAERFWSPATVRDPASALRRAIPVQEGLRLGGLLDDAQRHRMSARLAPADAGAVVTLAAATAPIRNFGRLWELFATLRKGGGLRMPELNTPADIAAPDSIEAYRLAVHVERFLSGRRDDAQALKSELAVFRDNHPRFIAASRGRPVLEKALPVSADVAALAQAGLDAIALIESGARPSPRWREETAALLKRQDEAEAASSSIPRSLSGAVHPPANLLIGIRPAVERLLRAAGL